MKLETLNFIPLEKIYLWQLMIKGLSKYKIYLELVTYMTFKFLKIQLFDIRNMKNPLVANYSAHNVKIRILKIIKI